MDSSSFDDIARYYNRVAFLFVPNICNAHCDFCYVMPVFTSGARLSPLVLRNAVAWLDILVEFGFAEIRLTGGEALAFSNLQDLIAEIVERGLTYRVLTNGIALREHQTTLAKFPPDRILISSHDPEARATVFGVNFSETSFRESLVLAKSLSEVELTVVLGSNEIRDFSRIADATLDYNPDYAKFVLANVEGSLSLAARFTNAVNDHFRNRESSHIRVSDVLSTQCRLNDKGFLSIDLASSLTHSCCVQVQDRSAAAAPYIKRPQRINSDAVHAILAELVATGLIESAQPCQSYYGACPIALKAP